MFEKKIIINHELKKLKAFMYNLSMPSNQITFLANEFIAYVNLSKDKINDLTFTYKFSNSNNIKNK